MGDEPRWKDEPPPGFAPDGTSLIAPEGEVKWPEEKIKGPDGKLYSPDEYAALTGKNDDEGIEDDDTDDDLSDLDDIEALTDA